METAKQLKHTKTGVLPLDSAHFQFLQIGLHGIRGGWIY